jgi:uncharacterized protein YbaR (Trm112 family)
MSGTFDDRVLVCPACLTRLALESGAMACTGCGRVYPIREGIPVLLLDEATQPANPAANGK